MVLRDAVLHNFKTNVFEILSLLFLFVNIKYHQSRKHIYASVVTQPFELQGQQRIRF